MAAWRAVVDLIALALLRSAMCAGGGVLVLEPGAHVPSLDMVCVDQVLWSSTPCPRQERRDPDAPLSIHSLGDIYRHVGERMRLRCCLDRHYASDNALNASNLHWQSDTTSAMLAEDARTSSSSPYASHLSVRSVKESDSGHYRCVVRSNNTSFYVCGRTLVVGGRVEIIFDWIG